MDQRLGSQDSDPAVGDYREQRELERACGGGYDRGMAYEFVDDDPEYESETNSDEDVDVADRVPSDPKEMPDDLGDPGDIERPDYET